MILIQGQGVSGGIAGGPVYYFRRPDAAVTDTPATDIEAEKRRVTQAREEAITQLHALAVKAREEAGEDAALLFETHVMFIEDEDYTACMMAALEERGCRAEKAAEVAGETFSAMLLSMDDAYMQARAADVKDVTRRILSNLTGSAGSGIAFEAPVILAAADLTPSETMQLDKSKIIGFITQEGSGSSHTAILARAMGIPAICGAGDAIGPALDGRTAYMDGGTGEIAIEPDAATLAAFQARQARQREQKERMEAMKGAEDVTLDGRRMTLCCNIGTPEDLPAVQANDGRGIGLFRSEFLYLATGGYPTEDEQFRAYKAAAAAMGGKRVVLRTLDIGADKQAEYFQLKEEENPALGVRAIRYCLSHPEVFRTQLRAMYRASAYGKVAIMFPMIASVWEVRECKRVCREVMSELDKEGIPYSRDTEIGIMIETPASVLIAEELAKEVDFFSVGTNDLTQYLLACDRQSGDLGKFFNPRHPAVLRALKLAADAAHRAGIWIGICGELGADVSMLETFLAIGIDELSVSPSSVLPLRAALRKIVAKTCTLDKLEY